MAHFSLENDLSNALRLDAPLTQGPLPRWQRKAMEGSSNESSFNNSSNTSAFMNMSVNKSSSKSNISPYKDDLAKRLTPGRNNRSKSPMPFQGDRFIPNRSAMQFELGHYMLSKANKESEENLSPNSSNYQKTMSDNLNGDLSNFRILAYQKKAPQAPSGHANALKILYSSSKNPGSTKKATRHIRQAPDRILDAPEIIDDYYLNLIDWSCSNTLAVALCGSLYLWNASTGEIQQLLDLPNQEDYISSVSWLPEGNNVLAVGTSTAEIQLWDVAAEKRIRTMKSHISRVSALSWNSYILSSGCKTGAIHHHDVRVAEHHVGTVNNHTHEVCGLRWSLDGRYLGSGGNDNLVNIWPSDAGIGQAEAQPLYTFSEHQAAVKAIAWSPWQPHVLATGGGTADRHIRFWNCNLGSCLNAIDTKSQVCAILWSKEYRELISGHGFAKNELIIWKYPSMEKLCELTGHKARVLNLAMSPDGSTVVSAGADETLQLWNCFATDPKKKKVPTGNSSVRSEIMKSGIR